MSDKLDFGDSTQNKGPVECLGMTFESDDARREYFTERLREKLTDPDFRKIEGTKVVTHGGASIDEVIVPFIHFTREEEAYGRN